MHRVARPRHAPRWVRLGLTGAWLVAAASTGRADDAAREFGSSNLSGNRWTYGWTPTRGAAFTLYDSYVTTPQGLRRWTTTGNRGSAYHNAGATVQNGIPPGALALYSGSPAPYAVVRYTAAFAGTFVVRARFTSLGTSFVPADVAVLNAGQTVFSVWLSPPSTGNTTSMSATLALDAGESVDFVAGPGDETSDYVVLDATVNLVPPSLGPAGPVLTFGGERFLPCRMESGAFESIAFDPVNRRLASRGDLIDLCGNRISDGPNESPGLAWDLREQNYWQITTDRVVRRWSAAGALLDTVFAIPLTFTVPGSGLDTLESVRGIAVDSNFVYVVDAGPDPGEVPSNAWFKFTRAGVPVKSSRTTDLVANLDADPDALVDDIVYAPFSSPFMPGRLLIALEHSGIQAIDAEGNFVDEFRWSGQSLTPTSAAHLAGKVTAFAGLTIDPATGNLYLVNNDGGTQVWTRIQEEGATSAAIGVVGNGVAGVLHRPNPGCNLPLWATVTGGSPSNLFGAAYRAAEHAIYTCSFGDGELWRFDARTGYGARIGHSGVPNVWGVAYDTERGVLYGGSEQSSGTRIVTIDPVTGAASPLPQATTHFLRDLAFNPLDHSIYGIDHGTAPARLIRVDRDTGVGTVVGNSVFASGLDFDAVTGRLIGINNQNRLFSIAPATGVAETLAVLPVSTGWEGLAVVPIPASVVVGVEGRHTPADPASIRVWPNPSRAGATIVFALPAAADVNLRVYDVAGRLVRDLQRRRLAPGQHRLEWDGRDAGGRRVASGVYFARLESGGHSQVARLTRIR